MSNITRTNRQLELILKSSKGIESEPVKKISTIYYWPDKKIVEVVPYKEK